jgi:hypothetical protein
MASGGGRPKADEWRNLMKVYPVGLAVAWELWNKSEDAEAPHPKSKTNVQKQSLKTRKLIRKQKVTFMAQDPTSLPDDILELDDIEPSRNYHDHYQNVLRYCTAVRILVTRSITPFEADRTQTFLSEAFQSWARMDCHLVPNCHNCQHLIEYILAYGPVYGWWVWAYERAIGILSKVKNNGHGGGEIESTYMRAWWKMIMSQELVCRTFTHWADLSGLNSVLPGLPFARTHLSYTQR